MHLISFSFAGFAVLFICLYFGLSKSPFRQWLLPAAGLFVLYSASGALPAAIVLCDLLIVWFAAIRMEACPKEQTAKRTRCLFAGLFACLGTLLYFKYCNGTLLPSPDENGMPVPLIPRIAFPLGLSYFSLSLCAFLLDVFHGKHPAEKNFAAFTGFALYFPSLFQGPVNYYKTLSPALRAVHRFDFSLFVRGLQRILWGLIKKMVIADRIGLHVYELLGSEAVQGGFLFYAMVLYSFQIYADFSGGIDVIMGLSEILGIDLPENFRAPLTAKSVTEFWKRWHMTLGRFMEKYVYYPLVLGKRTRRLVRRLPKGYLRDVLVAAVGNFIVFLLVGIWHGTGWNYLVYGVYQAFFTTLAILTAPLFKRRGDKKRNEASHPFADFLRILRTFLILVFGRYFIRAADLSGAALLFRRTFSDWNPAVFTNGTLFQYGLNRANWIIMILGILLLIAVDLVNEKGIVLRDRIAAFPAVFRFAVYYAGIFAVIVFGIYGENYHASSFIYAGF